MTENKAEICAKLGELLKLTRAGEHIDRIEYDSEKDCAAVFCKDKYGRLSSFGLRYVNTAGDSGMQMIADIIKDVWG